jgi:hypothetical protein
MADDFELQYRKLISDSIAKRDGSPIPNGTNRHASMLIEAMFANAQKAVRILTGELDARVYGTPEIIREAGQFLANSDHSLTVIAESGFDDDEISRHPLLSTIQASANFHLYRATPELTSVLKFHFALMDDDSYRFEADKSKTAAIAAFGDKPFAQTLAGLFEAIHGVAQEIRKPVAA